MREPLTENFTIPATYDEFKNWLTSYNIANEKYPTPITGRSSYESRDHRWLYTIGYQTDGEGLLSLDIKIEDTELLAVTATLFSRTIENKDGTMLLILDDTPSFIDKFRKLVEAIRKKYTRHETLGILTTSEAGRQYPQTRKDETLPAVELPMPHYDIDGWDAVFNWWYSIPRWICLNLKELAKKQNVAHETAIRNHGIYVDKYGQRPIQ